MIRRPRPVERLLDSGTDELRHSLKDAHAATTLHHITISDSRKRALRANAIPSRGIDGVSVRRICATFASEEFIRCRKWLHSSIPRLDSRDPVRHPSTGPDLRREPRPGKIWRDFV